LQDVLASVPLDELDPPTAAALDELVVAADEALRRAPRADVVRSSGGGTEAPSPMSSRRRIFGWWRLGARRSSRWTMRISPTTRA
jgi:hypothetical protein